MHRRLSPDKLPPQPTSASTRLAQIPVLMGLAAIAILMLVGPHALLAPAAGVNRLLQQLASPQDSHVSKEIAAQNLRSIFARQPWARRQIAGQQGSIPFAELLETKHPGLVEQSACLLWDSTQISQHSSVAQPRLAAVLGDPHCTALCQKCTIGILSSYDLTSEAILKGEGLDRALQWAGLQPVTDQAALRLLTPQTSSAASALLINMAALPQGIDHGTMHAPDPPEWGIAETDTACMYKVHQPVCAIVVMPQCGDVEGPDVTISLQAGCQCWTQQGCLRFFRELWKQQLPPHRRRLQQHQLVCWAIWLPTRALWRFWTRAYLLNPCWRCTLLYLI